MKKVEEVTDWFLNHVLINDGSIKNGHEIITLLESKLDAFKKRDKIYLLEKTGLECEELVNLKRPDLFVAFDSLGLFISNQLVNLTGERPAPPLYKEPNIDDFKHPRSFDGSTS